MAAIRDPAVRRRLPLVLVMLAAGATVVLSLPRLVAGAMFALAPGVHEDGSYPSRAEVPETLAWLERSQGWAASSEAGLYQAVSRQVAGLPGEKEALETLLAASPFRPEQWLRLGRIRLEDGDAAGALAAWRMSVYAARVHPPQMEERLDLGLALKHRMAPADLALLDDQLRLTFIIRPGRVQRVMDRPGNGVHRDYYAAVVGSLTEADIDTMIRIHALH